MLTKLEYISELETQVQELAKMNIDSTRKATALELENASLREMLKGLLEHKSFEPYLESVVAEEQDKLKMKMSSLQTVLPNPDSITPTLANPMPASQPMDHQMSNVPLVNSQMATPTTMPIGVPLEVSPPMAGAQLANPPGQMINNNPMGPPTIKVGNKPLNPPMMNSMMNAVAGAGMTPHSGPSFTNHPSPDIPVAPQHMNTSGMPNFVPAPLPSNSHAFRAPHNSPDSQTSQLSSNFQQFSSPESQTSQLSATSHLSANLQQFSLNKLETVPEGMENFGISMPNSSLGQPMKNVGINDMDTCIDEFVHIPMMDQFMD